MRRVRYFRQQRVEDVREGPSRGTIRRCLPARRKLLMTFRRNLGPLLGLSALVAAALLACGSDDGSEGGGPPIGPTDDAGVEGPIVQKEFPLETPSLGGYTLVDAFPGVVFDIPAAIAWPKTAGAAPFVLERTGQIRTIANGERRDLLDFGEKVHIAGEGGALGIALHPQFGNGTEVNQYVYVWYNACDVPGCEASYTQRLERYTWDGGSSTFDLDSAFTLIEQTEYENVHNAGKLLFGKDGFLYFGNGDDAETNNHQTIVNGLFAGIFRIDVDMDPNKSHPPPAHVPEAADPARPITIFERQGYFIPNDNPFVGAVANGLEEFWALGLRNPFGFAFDRQTGDLWLGDVGEAFREEINLVVKGGNYEWPIKEGELDNVESNIKSYSVGAPTPPKFVYSHAELGDLASVFGGSVYRGPSLPELNGKYVYTDWISNRVWALDIAQSPPTRTTLIDNQFKMQPMGTGEDNDGELYILQYGPDRSDEAWSGGRIKKLVKDASRDGIPKRLRETFLFDDVASLKPAANLVPYDVSSALWSDGSVKQRWIRLPAGQKVTVAGDGKLQFPVGTLFVKQFDLPANVTVANRTRHLETRVLVVGTDTTYGYSFRWNPEGTDAFLVSEGVDEILTDTTSGNAQKWHFPSFGQCWECHRNGWNDPDNTQRTDAYRILGFTLPQLAVPMPDGADQRTVLAQKGVFDPGAIASLTAGLPKPSDGSKSLEARAHSYLAANCSPCHHENASYTGGGETWLATFGAGDLAARHLDQNAKNYPMTVRLGIPNGQLVAPGDAASSVLLARIKSNDPDLRMPPLARNVVDTEGAALIEAWINSL
jgi:uncharacterized repeat protein (TIGR03806 family)